MGESGFTNFGPTCDTPPGPLNRCAQPTGDLVTRRPPSEYGEIETDNSLFNQKGQHARNMGVMAMSALQALNQFVRFRNCYPMGPICNKCLPPSLWSLERGRPLFQSPRCLFADAGATLRSGECDPPTPTVPAPQSALGKPPVCREVVAACLDQLIGGPVVATTERRPTVEKDVSDNAQ